MLAWCSGERLVGITISGIDIHYNETTISFLHKYLDLVVLISLVNSFYRSNQRNQPAIVS